MKGQITRLKRTATSLRDRLPAPPPPVAPSPSPALTEVEQQALAERWIYLLFKWHWLKFKGKRCCTNVLISPTSDHWEDWMGKIPDVLAKIVNVIVADPPGLIFLPIGANQLLAAKQALETGDIFVGFTCYRARLGSMGVTFPSDGLPISKRLADCANQEEHDRLEDLTQALRRAMTCWAEQTGQPIPGFVSSDKGEVISWIDSLFQSDQQFFLLSETDEP